MKTDQPGRLNANRVAPRIVQNCTLGQSFTLPHPGRGSQEFQWTILQRTLRRGELESTPSLKTGLGVVSFRWSDLICGWGALNVHFSHTRILSGWARCSIDEQDLTAQREKLSGFARKEGTSDFQSSLR